MSEISSLDNPGPFRWLVIDGSELGPDLNGGRLVCINGTGDLPLFMYTIDPSQCPVAEVPVIVQVPQQFTVPAVPEPSDLILLAAGIVISRLWFLRHRSV